MAGGLNRVAPRVAELCYAVLRDEFETKTASSPRQITTNNLPATASGDKPEGAWPTARLNVNGVEFVLAVTDYDRRSFWANYRKLGEKRAVYEPYMLAVLGRLLGRFDDPRFMDIGAYLGYFAFYAAALLKDRHEIYAVESNSNSAEAMRESVALNSLSLFRVLQVALSDRIEPFNAGLMATGMDAETGEPSMTISLDDLCAREGLNPNIVKIDVDGSDGKVILGMRETLKGIDAILLELHRLPFLARFSPGITRTQLLDTLEEAGLTLFYIAGQSSLLDGGVPPPDFAELLAGRGFTYRLLDKAARQLLLFDRSHDEFILALRDADEIEPLLGKSVSPPNE